MPGSVSWRRVACPAKQGRCHARNGALLRSLRWRTRKQKPAALIRGAVSGLGPPRRFLPRLSAGPVHPLWLDESGKPSTRTGHRNKLMMSFGGNVLIQFPLPPQHLAVATCIYVNGYVLVRRSPPGAGIAARVDWKERSKTRSQSGRSPHLVLGLKKRNHHQIISILPPGARYAVISKQRQPGPGSCPHPSPFPA